MLAMRRNQRDRVMHTLRRNPDALKGLVPRLSARLSTRWRFDDRRRRFGRIGRRRNRGIRRIQPQTQLQLAETRFQESNLLPQNPATGAVSLRHGTMLPKTMAFSCASFPVNGYTRSLRLVHSASSASKPPATQLQHGAKPARCPAASASMQIPALFTERPPQAREAATQ